MPSASRSMEHSSTLPSPKAPSPNHGGYASFHPQNNIMSLFAAPFKQGAVDNPGRGYHFTDSYWGVGANRLRGGLAGPDRTDPGHTAKGSAFGILENPPSFPPRQTIRELFHVRDAKGRQKFDGFHTMKGFLPSYGEFRRAHRPRAAAGALFLMVPHDVDDTLKKDKAALLWSTA